MKYCKELLFFFVLYHILQQIYAQTPGTQKWAFTAGGSISTSPAIGGDGTIYVGSNDNKLYAINPNGQQKWAFTTGGDVSSDPLIGGDGTIYVSSACHKFYAISPDGKLKWTFTTDDLFPSKPAIASDGTIYLGDDKTLYAIKQNGTPKWTFPTLAGCSSAIVINSEGTIYVGYRGDSYSMDRLYAINQDGSRKWEFGTMDIIIASPAIGGDGTIYVISSRGELIAINPNGKQKWLYKIGNQSESSVAISSDGTVYTSSLNDKFYAIDSNGIKKWELAIKIVDSSPTIGSDGTIYVGSDDKKLYAINPDGSQKWAFISGGSIITDPAIGKDGIIYIGSSSKLYAVYSKSLGLADSPWPKSHQNNRNTGKELSIYLTDMPAFGFLTSGSSFTKSFDVANPFANDVTIQSCILANPSFSLVTSLPATIVKNSKKTMQVKILPNQTDTYKSDVTLGYQNNTNTAMITGSINVGLFIDDGSETAVTAKRAVTAFNACKAQNPYSFATYNNIGVLYRLLKDYTSADRIMWIALSKSINARYGYAGIKMNLGVIESDLGWWNDPNEYYDLALDDLKSNSSTSPLAPQIYYNKAWYAYSRNNGTETIAQATKTIQHSKTSTYLKAKAYALRGAAYYRQKNLSSAGTDWLKVKSLDPKGPIGALAQNNLLLVNPLAITLRPGWNLISWNINTTNDSTKVLLKSIVSKVLVVLGYEKTGQTYDPKLPNLSTLSIMDHLHGYWIKMSAADTLQLFGESVDYKTTAIFCESGWNLVSYLPQVPDSIVHSLSWLIKDNLIVALGYKNGGMTFAPQFPSFNSLRVLTPYLGYWLKLNKATNLYYPQPLPGVNPVMWDVTNLAKSEDQILENTMDFVNPTTEWVNLYGQNIMHHGKLLPVGTIITAKNKNDVVCGSFTVQKDGTFGFMPIYLDDPNTEIVEGLLAGEEISLYYGSDRVPNTVRWTEMGDVIDIGSQMTEVKDMTEELPRSFDLSQNYPNPFNPRTKINYQLPKSAWVTLKIYNMLGQEIVTVLDGEKSAGYHQVAWDGKDSYGTRTASGMYVYTLSAGEFKAVKKMLLVY